MAPRWAEGFKFPLTRRPKLEAEVSDVVGLYLNPPDNAVVVCGEKSQCQALAPTKTPMRFSPISSAPSIE